LPGATILFSLSFGFERSALEGVQQLPPRRCFVACPLTRFSQSVLPNREHLSSFETLSTELVGASPLRGRGIQRREQRDGARPLPPCPPFPSSFWFFFCFFFFWCGWGSSSESSLLGPFFTWLGERVKRNGPPYFPHLQVLCSRSKIVSFFVVREFFFYNTLSSASLLKYALH